jgi:hypothetical protein
MLLLLAPAGTVLSNGCRGWCRDRIVDRSILLTLLGSARQAGINLGLNLGVNPPDLFVLGLQLISLFC